MPLHYRLFLLLFISFPTGVFGQSIFLSPSSDYPASNFGVTITGSGTNFSEASTTCALLTGPETININIINVTGPTSISAQINLPYDIKTGTYNAIVYENNGCGGTPAACTNCFTILDPFISPSPNSGKAGESIGFSVVGVGTDFQTNASTCAIISNGIDSYSVDATPSSSDVFSALLEIPCSASPGNYDVTIFRTECSGFSYSCSNCFVIEEADPGTVSISPNIADPGVTSVHAIAGMNTCFETGAAICVDISNGSEVYSIVGTANSNNDFVGSLTLPCSASNALYDLTVYSDAACNGATYSCSNCFGVRALTGGEFTISPNTINPGVPVQIAALGNGTCFDAAETVCMQITDGTNTYSLNGNSPSISSFVTDSYTPACDIPLGTYDVILYVGPGCTGYNWACADCLTVEDAGNRISLSPNNLIRGQDSNIDITGICSDFLTGVSGTTCAELTNGSQTYNITGSAISQTSFSGTVSLPSNAPSGAYNAMIYQGTGCTGSTWACTNCFTVGDSISMSPDSGLRGASVALTLTGVDTDFSITNTSCVEVFNATETYTILGVANGATNFTGTLNLPGIASSGTYHVNIYEGPGCGGAYWSCTDCFTVLDSISVSPASAVVGQTVQLTVNGMDTEFDAADTDCARLSGPVDYIITGSASNSTLFNGSVTIPNDGFDGTYDLIVYEGPGCVGRSWICSDCFTIEPAIPLPAELLAFDANREGDFVALDWQTAAEQNLAYFEPQHSLDGQHWQGLSQITARGNSSLGHHYQYLDTKPVDGLNYYRLLQIDLDGQYTYSQLVSVDFDRPNLQIQVFPNPVNDLAHLVIDSKGNSDLDIQLTDLSGKQVLKAQHTIEGGQQQIDVDMQDLAAGIYYLTVRQDQFTKVYRLLKM